jgi:tRNA U34 5-carboxymethylaminomethyl modifying GTPase MnmE/TrmE
VKFIFVIAMCDQIMHLQNQLQELDQKNKLQVMHYNVNDIIQTMQHIQKKFNMKDIIQKM